ncbi:trans-acting enoyl reductase family protein [Williamsia sp. CHRR-6]|uniref:saccharopine dehydrogenase family protein n=1 Tax=Williamsia sp. CHRR-6 TaxID=2835871 RepID=UPI001BDAB08A|nr:saccharopine dehydrogenase NADP-binding domain-containing protein [Williamsia sp. CHRR-6]MBT0565910.1 saccharopine dehydrogenase NADP-binding domain-containing protein [Williamsia sp. CHRR-6]
MTDTREFDVVIYGATGFVGVLTAAYLAEHAPAGTRIALAGRSEAKLARTRASLPAAAHDWPLIVADADSAAALDAMAARTRVVCTTVGPYLKYGELVLAATVNAGSDYVDLTGEVPFVRMSIDKYHDQAAANGARIVHSCGFDSVPSDIGVYLLHRAVSDAEAGELTDTTLVVSSFKGGVSGGTIDSMRVIAQQAKDPAVRRTLLDPQSLSTGPGEHRVGGGVKQPSDVQLVRGSTIDPSIRGVLAPFVMSSHNTRIVRRSNALLHGAYGKDFRYGEVMAVGRNPVISGAIAGAITALTPIMLGAMAFGPTRRLLDKVLPKPGDGPSEKTRTTGHFTTDVYTTTTTGRRFSSRMRAKGDPGYQATAVMLGECALTLALDRDKLPAGGGVLTPAAAMGDALIERLRGAGISLTAGPTG